MNKLFFHRAIIGTLINALFVGHLDTRCEFRSFAVVRVSIYLLFYIFLCNEEFLLCVGVIRIY